MRKISYCFLIMATALIIISCSDKNDRALTAINPGLYEIKFDIQYVGQPVILKQRVRYKSDGTYEATNFKNDDVVEELKGKFKIENNQLLYYDTQHRFIPREGEGTWKQKYLLKVDIREIKRDSYQYYFKFPNEQLREKYAVPGLLEGWKTYKRISD